jgi:hypothetical protein
MFCLRKHAITMALLVTLSISVVALLACACSSSVGDRPQLLYFRSAT